MTAATVTTTAPARSPKRLQGTPEHPGVAAGTAVWVGRGSELANPFEVYEHCSGPRSDWGVHDVGRFHAPCTHGWTRVGAAKHAVACFTTEFAKVYPAGSSAQFGLAFWLHCKDLVCDCPLEVDGAQYSCHADELLRIVGELDEALHREPA